ncbi:MAG: hypothetical protein ACP5D2_04780 [Candidatus Nanoarchaeia archaeon]
MADKRIVDGLTSERLIDEMNSSLFLDYLGKSISHTRNTGYETSFELIRSPEQDEFYYPNKISVGDSTSVGIMHYNERHLQLIEEFEKTTGHSFPNITDYAGSGTRLLEFNMLKENYETALKKFLQNKKEDFEIDIPTPQNKRLEYSWHFQDAYPSIDVHTHPAHRIGGIFEISNMVPSVLDLKYLREMKQKLESGSLEDLPQESYEEEELIKIGANPLILIAGTGEVNSGYPLKLLTCYNGSAKDGEIIEFNQRMRELEARRFRHPTPKIIRNGNFAQALGYYNHRQGRVDFEANSLDALLALD